MKKLLCFAIALICGAHFAKADHLTYGDAREVADSLMNVSVYPTIPTDTVTMPITIGKKSVNFVKKYRVSTKGENVSEKLQRAIDELSESGGGKLIIDKGDYLMGNIHLKSNVHLMIDHRVIIRPYSESAKQCILFHVGSRPSTSPTVRNISIQGVGGRFKVILPKEMRYFDTKFVCISSSSVVGFYYANFDIYDNFTVMPALGFGGTRYNPENFIGPTNGLVMNITIVDAHYGYGLVQTQAARNVRFYNLHGIGGITLRLETGAAGMNKTQFGGVFDIVGENISVANGHAAAVCGPHGMQNGVCHFRDITALSSGTAFGISGEALGRDGKGSGGSFADGTSVYNVTAIFGKHAQIKMKELYRIPEEYIDELSRPDMNKGIIWEAPAHTCVSIQAKAKIDYDINTFHSIGFKYGDPIVISDKKEGDAAKQSRMTKYLENKYEGYKKGSTKKSKEPKKRGKKPKKTKKSKKR